MSIEILREIKRFEEEARKIVEDAEKQAEELLKKIEVDKRKIEEDVKIKANQQITKIKEAAIAKADEESKRIISENEKTLKELIEKTERNVNNAAEIIVKAIIGETD